MRTFKIALSLITFLLSVSVFAQKTYLQCGQLIDVEQGKILSEYTIVVEGNTIIDVVKGYSIGETSDIVVDLKSKTVMPGLMDMHVHLEGESNPKKYIERFTKSDIDVAFDAALYAKRTLMAGFTTVRDLGGSGVNTALRNAINRGVTEGPRVYSAGKSIATTGGHADPTNGYRRDLQGDPGPKEGVINSPEEARKAVRQRYKNGADVIKITATGGVLSVAKDGSGPQFTQEEVNAIVEIANEYGMITAAHAHGVEGMKRAILAGITSIEHGTKMDDEIRKLMVEKGTYYVPTISAGKFVAEKAKIKGYFPDIIVPKALEIGPLIDETFSKAYKAGVKIAFGTDSGVSPHGENGKEFKYMVDAGMPPMKAIQSATISTAQMLRINDKLGVIKKGYLADIIAVDDDPLKNISTMEKVSFVMKDGVVYK